jgi:hypothetical protein
MNWRVLISAMSLTVLVASGCASLKDSQNKFPETCLATCGRLRITPTDYILAVNISLQSASLFKKEELVKTFSCSTSRFGIGEQLDSFCTPRGLHRIAEKIGVDAPAGTIFKERRVVGSVAKLGVAAGGITTRIMWLEGLEPGFNRGSNGIVNVDTHYREIYIHGTGDQKSLGRPASHGCIHLADPDLISLYDLLPSGTLVWIAER